MVDALLQVSKVVEEELLHVNDSLIDTILEVSEGGTEEAAAESKDGIIVTCTYRGICVDDKLKPYMEKVSVIHIHCLRFPSAFMNDRSNNPLIVADNENSP